MYCLEGKRCSILLFFLHVLLMNHNFFVNQAFCFIFIMGVFFIPLLSELKYKNKILRGYDNDCFKRLGTKD